MQTEEIHEKLETLEAHIEHTRAEVKQELHEVSATVKSELQDAGNKIEGAIGEIKDALKKDRSANDDASELEQKLKPYEAVVEKAEAVLFFRNPIGLAVILLLVNFVFVIVYKFEFSFLPTLFLVLLVKCLIELAWGVAGRQVSAILFPEVEKGGPNESNRVRSLDDVCEFVAPVYKVAKNMKARTKGSGGFSTQNLITCGVLLGLVIVFKITGTFWLCWFAVNGLLIIPGVLLFPPVNEKVVEITKNFKKKAD